VGKGDGKGKEGMGGDKRGEIGKGRDEGKIGVGERVRWSDEGRGGGKVRRRGGQRRMGRAEERMGKECKRTGRGGGGGR